jgi:hypothetical protein
MKDVSADDAATLRAGPGNQTLANHGRLTPGGCARLVGMSTKKEPVVRVQWLVALAIVGIALLALMWVLFGTTGVG